MVIVPVVIRYTWLHCPWKPLFWSSVLRQWLTDTVLCNWWC